MGLDGSIKRLDFFDLNKEWVTYYAFIFKLKFEPIISQQRFFKVSEKNEKI